MSDSFIAFKGSNVTHVVHRDKQWLTVCQVNLVIHDDLIVEPDSGLEDYDKCQVCFKGE